MSGRVSCRECADFLADYVAGELPVEVRETFEVHLAKCANCRVYLEQYSAVITAGRTACQREDDLAADTFPEELVQAILDARKR